MFFKSLVIVCLFVSSYCQGPCNYTLVTTPSTRTGQRNVFVSANIGQANVSVTCRITTITNGNIVKVQWSFFNSSNHTTQLIFNDTSSDQLSSVVYSTTDDYQTIIISNFTTDWIGASLVCRPYAICNEPSETFVLGVPTAPNLISYIIVNRNAWSNFTVDLAINDPFPPYVISWWTYNEETIVNIDNIILYDYSLSMTSVQINQDGTYQLTVAHETGNFSASFVLNVQYQPAGGMPTSNAVAYGVLGIDVTLTFFTDLTGNPIPNITWTLDSNRVIIDGQHFASNYSQLSITNITGLDFGNYTANASNGIGTDLFATIELVQGMQPGQPTNIDVTNITHISAHLLWNEPNNTGAPPLNSYIVNIAPAVQGSPYTIATAELELNGLIPTTTYTATIVGVSSLFPNGGFTNSIVFDTTDGPPEFSTFDSTASNGNITFTWQLRHTGGFGYDEVSIRAFCSSVMDFILESGSGDIMEDNTFLYSCDSRCVSPSLEGFVSLGPVTAGTSYYCSLVVSNALGDVTESKNIIPILGKPSRPVVNAVANDGSIMVSLLCRYSGILSGQPILFNVTIKTGSMQFSRNYSYTDYTNNTNRSVDISVTSGQLYYIDVVALNSYGQSERGTADIITLTTPTTSSEPSTTSLLIIIIGATVGGLLLAAIVICMLICICACCLRKKKTRTLHFETTNTQTWKRSEVRGLEMSQRKH